MSDNNPPNAPKESGRLPLRFKAVLYDEAVGVKRRFIEESKGGRLGGFFGTDNETQLNNILAIVVVGLLLLVGATVIGSVVRNEGQSFKDIGVPLLAPLGTIVGYLIGERRRR